MSRISREPAATTFLVVGAGYSGRRVAEALAAEQRRVVITSRHQRPAEGENSDLVTLDLDRDETVQLPDGNLSVIYLVPPANTDPDRNPDPRLQRFLGALATAPQRFVLASTSGVYGDCRGAVVDEAQPAAPLSDRARRRTAQEGLLRAWAKQQRVQHVILRIAGIYGPGRLPLERIREGEPVIRAGEAFPSNRIHVDDLVRVIVAAALQVTAQGIYNVADGNHASSTEFYRRVAQLAGLPAAPEISRAEARHRLSPARYSFLAESRRLDTRRMREQLGITPRYADLDSGILASL